MSGCCAQARHSEGPNLFGGRDQHSPISTPHAAPEVRLSPPPAPSTQRLKRSLFRQVHGATAGESDAAGEAHVSKWEADREVSAEWI